MLRENVPHHVRRKEAKNNKHFPLEIAVNMSDKYKLDPYEQASRSMGKDSLGGSEKGQGGSGPRKGNGRPWLVVGEIQNWMNEVTDEQRTEVEDEGEAYQRNIDVFLVFGGREDEEPWRRNNGQNLDKYIYEADTTNESRHRGREREGHQRKTS